MASKFECVVSADLMRRALIGVSKEETRYYLNGVHISPAPEGGAVLTATDGHLLITLHDPDGIVSGEAIIMLNKQMKGALKTKGILLEKRLLLVRLKGGVGRAFVADIATKGEDESYSPYATAPEIFDEPDGRVQAAQFGPLAIDGTFPDWRRVIPEKLRPEAPLPIIDQRLMGRVAEALSPDGAAWRLRLTATGDDPANDPVLVTPYDQFGPSAIAVVMPLRSDSVSVKVPQWTRKAATPIAA